MRVLYALHCQQAEPRDDGSVDVHGVFHHLFARDFPAIQDRMVFALCLEWDVEGEGAQKFQLDLVDSTGDPCVTIQAETEVHAQRPHEPLPRTVVIMPMEDIRFQRADTYFFELKMNGETTRLAPLQLIEHPDV